jgi:hypothetical protein
MEGFRWDLKALCLGIWGFTFSGFRKRLLLGFRKRLLLGFGNWVFWDLKVGFSGISKLGFLGFESWVWELFVFLFFDVCLCCLLFLWFVF